MKEYEEFDKRELKRWGPTWLSTLARDRYRTRTVHQLVDFVSYAVASTRHRNSVSISAHAEKIGFRKRTLETTQGELCCA